MFEAGCIKRLLNQGIGSRAVSNLLSAVRPNLREPIGVFSNQLERNCDFRVAMVGRAHDAIGRSYFLVNQTLKLGVFGVRLGKRFVFLIG